MRSGDGFLCSASSVVHDSNVRHLRVLLEEEEGASLAEVARL